MQKEVPDLVQVHPRRTRRTNRKFKIRLTIPLSFLLRDHHLRLPSLNRDKGYLQVMAKRYPTPV